MRKILLILYLVLLVSVGYSQNGWFEQSGAFFGDAYEMHFFDENRGFVCNSGSIYRSTDGGETWLLVPNIIFAVYDIDFANNSLGFASGGSRVYKTTDAGVTWEEVYQFPGASTIVDITTADGNTIYALLAFDEIYKSTDGGVTFDTTNSRPLNGLWNSPSYLHAFSNSTLLISGPQFIFKSNDGGNSWFQVLDTGSGWNIYLYPQPDGRTFASVETGEILFGNSEGSGWNQIYKVPRDTTLPANLFSINFINNIGYAIRQTLNSTKTLLAKSYNNGYSWYYSSFPSPKRIRSLFFVDENIGWAAGKSSTVLKTTTGAVASSYFYFEKKNNINKIISDNQTTYDTITINTTGNFIITSPKILDMRVTIDTIIHTNSSELELTLLHLGISDTLAYGLISPGANFIYTIFDDSASGNIVSGSPPYTGAYQPYGSLSQFNNLDLNGDWVLQVFDNTTGNTGLLNAWGLEIVFEDNTLDVKTISNEIPNSYSLSQNYPNPFNPSTIIRFALPTADNVKLEVFNLLGERVATLVNGEMSAGIHEVNFEASKLSSGIYIYRIVTDRFAGTKKMILLK